VDGGESFGISSGLDIFTFIILHISSCTLSLHTNGRHLVRRLWGWIANSGNAALGRNDFGAVSWEENSITGECGRWQLCCTLSISA
jgi:hypothetical protein